MCTLYGEHREPWSSSDSDKELSAEEWFDIIRQLKAYGVQDVCFTGGEPLMRKDLPEIVGYAKKNGLAVNILTSGVLLQPETAFRLVQAGVDDISVSIDGPGEVHNAIRRGNFFDKAVGGIREIEGIKRRLKTDTPNVTIACTIQKMNQDCLCELVVLAHELGAHLAYGPLFFRSEKKSRRSLNLVAGTDPTKDENQNLLVCHRRVNVDILHDEIGRIQEEARRLGQSVYLPFRARKEIQWRFYDADYSVVNKCFVPWYASRIDPFGNVYPCSVNLKCGNLRDMSFGDIWNGPKYTAFRTALKKKGLFPGCAKCCALTSDRKFWSLLPRLGP